LAFLNYRKGSEIPREAHAVEFARDHDFTTTLEDEKFHQNARVNSKAYDVKLFEMLKAVRKQVAREKNLPPYVIFRTRHSKNGHNIPHQQGRPCGGERIGMGKVNKFEKILSTYSEVVDDNDIETASDVIVKSSVINPRSRSLLFSRSTAR